jgi:low affinity Fe/Cu permease
MKKQLRSVSSKISLMAGSAWTFGLAVLLIVIWGATGPHFHFSNTWLIAVTTIADVIVFLMVFSLQATQNRDSKAIQLKLNELIVANKQASNAFIGLESLTDEELGDLDGEFKEMLEKIAAKPVLHKLHKKIKEEKTNRSNLEQTGHIVNSLLGPLANNKAKQ